MTEQTAISTRHDIKSIMRSDEIRSRFTDIVGSNNAAGYISSVLIAVASSEALQRCTPTSIISAALRAATMRLSVEPALGHAYLVPFKSSCTLVVGYKGLYQMAIRTGKYRYLDLITVYANDVVTQHPVTGMYLLQRNGKTDTIQGYLLYFQLRSGFEKTFYMTIEECLKHGQEYSKSYRREDSLWKTNPDAMCKKTVMRLGLLRWGIFADDDARNINMFDDTDGIETTVGKVQMIDEPKIDEPKIDAKQAMVDLGFDIPDADPVIETPPAKELVNGGDVKPNKTVDTMTLDDAMAMTDSKGRAYGDMTNDELSKYAYGINKALRGGELDNRRQETYLRKLQAIKLIDDASNSGQSTLDLPAEDGG